MGRSSSSDSTSRSSRSSRKEVKKSKKDKSEKRSRHNSRSPDSRKKRSRSRSRDRNRHRRKIKSRSRERHSHKSRKTHKSDRIHSQSKTRSRSKEYGVSSRSRRSSASTVGSSDQNSTAPEVLSSDEGSSRQSHLLSRIKTLNERTNKSNESKYLSKRSSREPVPTNQPSSSFNSREGSSAREECVQDIIVSKFSAAESAAIAAEKVLGMKPRDSNITNCSNDVVSKLKMDTAIREVESTSFEQKTFKSSRLQQSLHQTAEIHDSEQFQFGTSAEKVAVQESGIGEKSISNIFKSIAGEGLCHPNLFGDPLIREERWLHYLVKLRESIHAEKNDVNINS